MGDSGEAPRGNGPGDGRNNGQENGQEEEAPNPMVMAAMMVRSLFIPRMTAC